MIARSGSVITAVIALKQIVKNIDSPLSQIETERLAAEANRQLIESDLAGFAKNHGCVIPDYILRLYSDHDLLRKRHFHTMQGVVLRWFCPLNDKTHIHTDCDGQRYAIFACAGDGESFCFPMDGNDNRIHVLWDSGELDAIDVAAYELRPSPSR